MYVFFFCYFGVFERMYILFVLITFLSKMRARVLEIETRGIDEDITIVSPITIQVTVLTTDPAIPHVVWSLIDFQGNVISNITSLTGRIRPVQYERFSSSAHLDFPSTPELVGRSVRVRISAFYGQQKGLTVYSKGLLNFLAPWKLSLSRFAIMGEEMETTCIFTNNPIFTVTEVLLTNSTRIKLTTNTKTCQMESTIYNVMVSCSEMSFTLTFSTTTVEFNQSHWRCFDDLDKTKSSRFEKMEIAVLPSNVKLLPRKISGFEGDTVSMACVSKRLGYPEPTYKWFIGIQETNYSTPNITLVLQENLHGLNIKCSMETIRNRTTLSEEVRINVYFLPSMGLVMEGIKSKLYREDGKFMNITCWIPTANPLPQLTLSCNEGTNGTVSTNATTVSALLLLRQDRNLNGVECICKVAQALTMYTHEERRIINVIYAPIVTVSSITVSNGDKNIRLNCSVSANPAVHQLYWEHTVRDMLVRNQTALQGFIEELHPHSLFFPDLSYEDDGVYSCFASNGVLSMNNSMVTTGSGKLTVKVKPVFMDLPLEFVGSIGRSMNIQFSFYSCPRVSSKGIVIYKKDRMFFPKRNFVLKDAAVQVLIHGSQVEIDGQIIIFEIDELNMISEGTYIVRLENDDGQEAESYFMIKAKEEKDDDTSTSIVLDIILKWISPTLLCLVLFGGTIILARRLFKRRSQTQEFQNCADSVNEVQSINGRQSDLTENEEDSVYCLVHHPTNCDTENVDNGVQEVTLLAESGFVNQTSEDASTMSGDDINQDIDHTEEREKYETLKTDKERCEDDEYTVLHS